MYSPLLEAGPVALYAQLAGILRERIKSGTWPSASEIPTLPELAAEFGVARVTVRQAIQILVSEKLVSSQRGRRTFVTYNPGKQDKNPLFMSINLMSAVTPDYEIKILSRDDVSDTYLGSIFFGRPHGQYVRIRKVDYESGTPYSVSTHFIARQIFKRFPPASEGEVKIARLVRDRARNLLAECRERVTVGAADLEESQHLHCPMSSPVARVHRVFVDSNKHAIYFGSLTFRSDRFGIERDITDLVRS